MMMQTQAQSNSEKPQFSQVMPDIFFIFLSLSRFIC